jgi:hypothetical protein
MKNFIFIVLPVLIVLQIETHAQEWQIGVQGGSQMCYLRGKDIQTERKPTFGYQFGAVWETKINDEFFLESGLVFSKQGQHFVDNYDPTIENPSIPLEIELMYFRIPFVLKYNFWKKEDSKLSVFAGLGISSLYNANSKFRFSFDDYYLTPYYPFNMKYSLLEFSSLAGLKYSKQVNNRFEFNTTVFFDIGWTDLFDNDRMLWKQPPPFRLKNATGGLSMGINYRFFSNKMLNNDLNHPEGKQNKENKMIGRNSFFAEYGAGMFLPSINNYKGYSWGKFQLISPINFDRVFQLNHYHKISINSGIAIKKGSFLLTEEYSDRYDGKFNSPSIYVGVSYLSGFKNHLEINIKTSGLSYEEPAFTPNWPGYEFQLNSKTETLNNLILYLGYRYQKLDLNVSQKIRFIIRSGLNYEYMIGYWCFYVTGSIGLSF